MAGEHILVVEDDPAILKLVGTMLGAEGYRVTAAGDAETAFKVLGLDGESGTEPAPDLVLMDIALPRVDGLEACRRIKASEQLSDLPVLFVTASGTQSAAMEAAFAAGAQDFIGKPIHRIELLARVRSAIRLKQEIEACRARESELEVSARLLEVANQQLQTLAAVDPVTGIANRRKFDERIEWEWRRAARTETPLSVILIDIDHFKLYNDAYGHPAGDEVLRHVATALSGANQRATDLVARYGGEEFVVVLGQTDREQAAAVAELLRARLETIKVPHRNAPGGHLTISLGVATVVPSVTWSFSWADLLQAADRALYEAKRAGRNRVVQAPPILP